MSFAAVKLACERQGPINEHPLEALDWSYLSAGNSLPERYPTASTSNCQGAMLRSHGPGTLPHGLPNA